MKRRNPIAGSLSNAAFRQRVKKKAVKKKPTMAELLSQSEEMKLDWKTQ